MSYFTEQERKEIKECIEQIEAQTTGEICICVEQYCDQDPITRAQEYFVKLEMTKAKRRNGVLIYLALSDNVFAIIGDEGIHNIVGEIFWEDAKTAMKENFKHGEIVKGVILGVRKVGDVLIQHFPKTDDDQNELKDDIIFGDK
ncbi:MAG: TPM domain-containing protein [Saprospiraceae bacterium]|jgi:uncharacterized membrane protein|nr:TPM domain-containing protein [Saprospiraceae bacterium]